MSTAKLSTKYDCAKTKVVGNLPADAKGAHVANALRVDAGIGVSKVFSIISEKKIHPDGCEKVRLGTKSRKSSAIGYNVSILNTE